MPNFNNVNSLSTAYRKLSPTTTLLHRGHESAAYSAQFTHNNKATRPPLDDQTFSATCRCSTFSSVSRGWLILVQEKIQINSMLRRSTTGFQIHTVLKGNINENKTTKDSNDMGQFWTAGPVLINSASYALCCCRAGKEISSQ